MLLHSMLDTYEFQEWRHSTTQIVCKKHQANLCVKFVLDVSRPYFILMFWLKSNAFKKVYFTGDSLFSSVWNPWEMRCVFCLLLDKAFTLTQGTPIMIRNKWLTSFQSWKGIKRTEPQGPVWKKVFFTSGMFSHLCFPFIPIEI